MPFARPWIGRGPDADDPESADGTDRVHGSQDSRSTEELCRLLEERGYEPTIESNGSIGLRNCPFHRLSRTHTDLVCSLNQTLLSSVLAGRGEDPARAELCPHEGRCCVVLRAEAAAAADG